MESTKLYVHLTLKYFLYSHGKMHGLVQCGHHTLNKVYTNIERVCNVNQD